MTVIPSPCLCSLANGSKTKSSSQLLWRVVAFSAPGKGIVAGGSCQTERDSPHHPDVLGTHGKLGRSGANFETLKNLQGFRAKAVAGREKTLARADGFNFDFMPVWFPQRRKECAK